MSEAIDWKERAETYLFDQELYKKECDALRKQLAEAITEKDKWIKIYETESKLRRKDLIESDALRKLLEEEHTAALKITEQWITKSKQLDIVVTRLNELKTRAIDIPCHTDYELIRIIDNALAEINRIGTESGVNRTIDDKDGMELKV
jgi:hypothetical protein